MAVRAALQTVMDVPPGYRSGIANGSGICWIAPWYPQKNMNPIGVRALCLGEILAVAAAFASAQTLPDLDKRISEFTLPNGLHFVVAQRNGSPVVSFRTYINAGSADVPPGESGLARLIERLSS